MSAKLLIIPFIGAFIGWITNKLAIKFIFWPLKPIKIPLINFEFQGVIPKRRKEIASTVGLIVERELLSAEDFINYLNSSETKKKIVDGAVLELNRTVLNRMPKYVPFKKYFEELIESRLSNELPKIIDSISKNISEDLKSSFVLSKTVEDKLNSLDLLYLENLTYEIASRELNHIEVMGAVLGFLIGLIQVAFAVFL